MRDNNRGPNFLGTGDYLGLEFADAGWWFTHVIQTEEIELKPWILLNENENRDVIAAETAGSEDDLFKDTVGREFIVPNDDEKNMIFQVRFGIAPSRMQIYPFFGRDRSPNLRGTAEPGEPQVAFTGFDSPYNNPTRQAEIFTINSMSQPSLQAYNPMPEDEEARVSVHVNKIKYATIEDKDLMKAMIQGQVPFREHPMGLGAQKQDQIKAPGWLQDNFADVMHTTEEILASGESSNTPGRNLPTGGN